MFLNSQSKNLPHGNPDSEKDGIRKALVSAQLNIIRLVLSISRIIDLGLATVDIKEAYVQSWPIRRKLYVRPPLEWHSTPVYTRVILWKLAKLFYGIVEAGRQWKMTIETWMLED